MCVLFSRVSRDIVEFKLFLEIMKRKGVILHSLHEDWSSDEPLEEIEKKWKHHSLSTGQGTYSKISSTIRHHCNIWTKVKCFSFLLLILLTWFFPFSSGMFLHSFRIWKSSFLCEHLPFLSMEKVETICLFCCTFLMFILLKVIPSTPNPSSSICYFQKQASWRPLYRLVPMTSPGIAF